MGALDTPDLCAHLDRLKHLCDKLEDAQDDRAKYQDLVARIRVETEALRAVVCAIDPTSPD